ncbi:hypothetical protein [Bradyrhizobium sp.]|uniref:hypothetical protein n=1 Tax=Bradyrhizobium sp. TaxID=376 RepID=UPI003C495670
MTDEAFPWISDASADDGLTRSAFDTQFPRPWTVEHRFESFAVFDANHRPLAHFYFQKGPNRLYRSNYLGREDAWHLATSFAKFGDSVGAAANRPRRNVEAQLPAAFAGSKPVSGHAN